MVRYLREPIVSRSVESAATQTATFVVARGGRRVEVPVRSLVWEEGTSRFWAVAVLYRGSTDVPVTGRYDADAFERWLRPSLGWRLRRAIGRLRDDFVHLLSQGERWQ